MAARWAGRRESMSDDTTDRLRDEVEDDKRILFEGAQGALLDMALAEAPGSIERIELLNRVADSAKRFGRQVNDRQIDRLLDVAADADGPAATAAAAAVGVMNLDNARLLRLIDAQ